MLTHAHTLLDHLSAPLSDDKQARRWCPCEVNLKESCHARRPQGESMCVWVVMPGRNLAQVCRRCMHQPRERGGEGGVGRRGRVELGVWKWARLGGG